MQVLEDWCNNYGMQGGSGVLNQLQAGDGSAHHEDRGAGR